MESSPAWTDNVVINSHLLSDQKFCIDSKSTKFGANSDLTKFGADSKFLSDSKVSNLEVTVSKDRQWEEDDNERCQIFGNSELSNSRLKTMQLEYRREEHQLDLQIKAAQTELGLLEQKISQLTSEERKVWSSRKDVALVIQMNKVVWKSNKIKVENSIEEVQLIADQIADVKIDYRKVSHEIEFATESRKFFELEKQTAAARVQEDIDRSSLGQELTQAKIKLSNITSVVETLESETGSESSLEKETAELESENALVNEEVDMLTVESLRRKEMFLKSKETLEQIEKEIKILKNKREAQKIRLRKKVVEMKKWKKAKEEKNNSVALDVARPLLANATSEASNPTLPDA